MKRRALVASMGFLGLHRSATANESETILTIQRRVEPGSPRTGQSYVFTKKTFFALPRVDRSKFVTVVRPNLSLRY